MDGDTQLSVMVVDNRGSINTRMLLANHSRLRQTRRQLRPQSILHVIWHERVLLPVRHQLAVQDRDRGIYGTFAKDVVWNDMGACGKGVRGEEK
jgi:hypothetical protein